MLELNGTRLAARLHTIQRRLEAMPPRVVDITIALAAFFATAGPVLVPAPDRPWLVALAAASSLPLIWRRRVTLLVTLVVGSATTALALLQELPPLPYGVLVCTYTYAELLTAGWRLIAVAVQSIVIILSLAVPDEGAAAFGYVGMAFVTAYSLGAGVRNRKAHIGLLEERARRLEEEQAAVAALERNRIARDMHDVVAHSVTLMVVQADAGPIAVRSDPDRAEAAFEAIAETGRGAISQLRRILGALRSDGSGTERSPQPGIGAVQALVTEAGRTGLKASLRNTGTPATVPVDVDIAVYRVVQESLTNTLKHARARTVEVGLVWAPRQLTVRIIDDGTGQPPATESGGHGMIGMRERVSACGGSFRAAVRERGPGFAVTALFPLG
ncbi:MAG TPA: sensor histidine kinase [Mycobacteriales bacterium]|nr:sensor histidine kinase [Mycobacteriales bacterium]